MKVLLIEDDPEDVCLLREALAEAGEYELTHVETLAKGLEHVQNHDVDVALVDLGLPDSQGMDTVRELLSKVPDLPVVVLSGNSDKQIESDVVRYGAQDYLAKDGLNPYQVSHTLRHAVARARLAIELNAAQDKLNRAERLEAAGTLAGQVAHDVNNLLNPLQIYAQMIRNAVDKDEELSGYSDAMLKLVDDLHHLNLQLRDMANRGRLEESKIDLNVIIEEVVRRTRDVAADTNIEIKMSLDPELFPIQGGAGQLGRVIQNLCQNATDALETEGTLMVFTENIPQGAPNGKVELPDSDYIKITIADNGGGIPADVRERVFEPFFTTKRASTRRGSGLGLSIVRGIIEDHRGIIDFETEEGEGTTFHLYFPRLLEV